MGTVARLCIYDATDTATQNIALDRDAATHLGAGDRASLRHGLDSLVKQQNRYTRLVFDTHGNSGWIFFGKQGINADWWNALYAGRGYEKLFPGYSRMYFSGCNVSDTEDGWQFLESANRIFFRSGGGVSLAYTSVGITTRWGTFSAKHLWGDLRLVIRDEKGNVRRYDGSNLWKDLAKGRLDEETLKAVTGD